jgi:hypothetical protein
VSCDPLRFVATSGSFEQEGVQRSQCVRTEDELAPVVGTTPDEVEQPGEAVPDRVRTWRQELEATAAEQLLFPVVVALAQGHDK